MKKNEHFFSGDFSIEDKSVYSQVLTKKSITSKYYEEKEGNNENKYFITREFANEGKSIVEELIDLFYKNLDKY